MKQVIRKKIVEAHNIDTREKINTLIIDGNSLLKVSLVDRKTNRDGVVYGAIWQFLNKIRILLGEKDYNFVYCVWDGDNSGILRYRIYNDYKANRDKNYEGVLLESEKSDYQKKLDERLQFMMGKLFKKTEEEEDFDRQKTILSMIFQETFIRELSFDGIEGDDIIAYYVNHKKDNENVIIISGDMDITQLISDTVSVYVPKDKKLLTKENFKKEIGYPSENIVVKKIICGDDSDNIKGIDGIGEKTFFKLFPIATERKIDLKEIIEYAIAQQKEREKGRKRPLKALENIIESNTSGIQGKGIYDINKRLIDLSEPMLTDEAIKGIEEMMYAPIDPSDRNSKNLYTIILENKIESLIDSNNFSEFFSTFGRHILNEKNYYKKEMKI